MRSILTNPEALQAIMQIQQGMQRLQTAASPDVLSGLGFGTFPPAPSSTTTTSTNNTSSTQQTTRPSLFNTQQPNNYFSQMLNMMGNNTLVGIFCKTVFGFKCLILVYFE